MPKKKTQAESAAGKLISAIQKEWTAELGEPQDEESEAVMHKAHDLLINANNIEQALKCMSVTQFLGTVWVYKHPKIKQAILNFEVALKENNKV